jgi:hypothetical protein
LAGWWWLRDEGRRRQLIYHMDGESEEWRVRLGWDGDGDVADRRRVRDETRRRRCRRCRYGLKMWLKQMALCVV